MSLSDRTQQMRGSVLEIPARAEQAAVAQVPVLASGGGRKHVLARIVSRGCRWGGPGYVQFPKSGGSLGRCTRPVASAPGVAHPIATTASTCLPCMTCGSEDVEATLRTSMVTYCRCRVRAYLAAPEDLPVEPA